MVVAALLDHVKKKNKEGLRVVRPIEISQKKWVKRQKKG